MGRKEMLLGLLLAMLESRKGIPCTEGLCAKACVCRRSTPRKPEAAFNGVTIWRRNRSRGVCSWEAVNGIVSSSVRNCRAVGRVEGTP